MKEHKASAAILLAIGMILFGSATPFSKLISNELPVFTASSLRVLLGTIVLLPLIWRDLSEIRKINYSQWKYISLISIFGIVGFTAFLMKGMSYISGVSGSVIMATVPVVTAIGARFYLKSKFTKLKIWATIFATSGALTLHLFKSKHSGGGDDNLLLGTSFVFLAVCCEAIYTLIGKKVTENSSPLLVTFLACLLACPIFILLSFFESNGWSSVLNLDSKSYFSIGWWGVGTLALGSVCWYKGVSKAPASTAPAFMGLMPLSALVLSYLLLDEQFQWIHLIGFGLVFIGVLLMSRAHMKMQH
jgi:drug/metabolite transporter (DMT)-like permease